MTNQKNPNHNENRGNERTVSNPKAPGEAARVDPVTGGDAGTIDSNNVKR